MPPRESLQLKWERQKTDVYALHEWDARRALVPEDIQFILSPYDALEMIHHFEAFLGSALFTRIHRHIHLTTTRRLHSASWMKCIHLRLRQRRRLGHRFRHPACRSGAGAGIPPAGGYSGRHRYAFAQSPRAAARAGGAQPDPPGKVAESGGAVVYSGAASGRAKSLQ
jgi:hypothetical protein